MNGRLVVSGLVAGVAGCALLAWFWPEGRAEDDALRTEASAPPSPAPDHGAAAPKEQGLTYSNVPEGKVGRAEAAIAARDAKRAAEGPTPENPFLVFLGRGESISAAATAQPDMTRMAPSTPGYDPMVDARQRFFNYEADLMERQPLDPTSWREVTAAHRDDLAGTLKRAKELTDAGQEEKARVLLQEWTTLQNTYKAAAYGRSGPPGEPR